MLKDKLLLICKAMHVEKSYEVDEMTRKSGHEVVRLPPYHCQFNPIL